MPSKKSAKTVKKPVVKAEEALPVEPIITSEPEAMATDVVECLTAEGAYRVWSQKVETALRWEELTEAEKSGFEQAAAFVAAGNAPRTTFERCVARAHNFF